MKQLLTLLLIWYFTPAFAQTKSSCNCPKTEYAATKADADFRFSSGKTIVLCGYENKESQPVTYSEFVLAVCGNEQIIDFWDATTTCQLEMNKDTLLVKQLQNLPVGEGFKFQETVWTIEKLYFENGKLVRKQSLNRQIRKYDQKEIRTVLKSFETAKPGLDESKMKIAYQLFTAAISGDKTAGQYFKEFKNKFGTLDGAYKEEYKELEAMLVLWNKSE